MRHAFCIICLGFLFVCCSGPIVEQQYIDSLLTNYSESGIKSVNQQDIEFWRKRIDPTNPQFQNELKYAGALVTRFRINGDIQDVADAERVYRQVNETYHSRIPGPFLGLTSSAMLTHRFAEADTLMAKARSLGIHAYVDKLLSFDLAFEHGRYAEATFLLKQIKPYSDFNYYFRQSKFDHFKGDMDAALGAMKKAADLEKGNAALENLALSSLGDLYLHAGDFEQAAVYYRKSIAINHDDFHSVMGMGWIALTADKNVPLAAKVFSFVCPQYHLPDPLYKLYQASQLAGDSSVVRNSAIDYIHMATDNRYGRMFNKYLIEIYCLTTHEPDKAEALAFDELNNRRTPQTYAWYAFSLYKNGKQSEAYTVFQKEVSEQPLEGLELYYMGLLLKREGKGYDALQYFKAAYENRYDLSPAIQADLAERLEK